MPEQPSGLAVPADEAAAATPATAAPAGAPTSLPQDPGATIGIIGFIFAFLAAPVGLVLSLVALVRSRRTGHRNGFAIAGVVIAGTILAVWALALALILPPVVDAVQTCQELGLGVHQQGDVRYTCTPTSSHVYRSFG